MREKKYEPVEVREFRSAIPPHLLGLLSESERYIVETMSKLEHRSDWLVEVAVQNNRDIIDAGERLNEDKEWQTGADKRIQSAETRVAAIEKIGEKVDALWDWKTLMSGKWAILWALALIVLSTAAKYLLDIWTKKGP